jgi:ubiquinone/menaquinone biosynthesis C-methylase UbiE
VMFCYSIGHGVLQTALAEAARVLRPNGVLFIYDMAGEPDAIAEELGYVVRQPRHICLEAESAGFTVDFILDQPETTVAAFERLFPEIDLSAVRPIAARFIKGAR